MTGDDFEADADQGVVGAATHTDKGDQPLSVLLQRNVAFEHSQYTSQAESLPGDHSGRRELKTVRISSSVRVSATKRITSGFCCSVKKNVQSFSVSGRQSRRDVCNTGTGLSPE